MQKGCALVLYLLHVVIRQPWMVKGELINMTRAWDILTGSPFTFPYRVQNSPSLFTDNLGGCSALHFVSTECWPTVHLVSADTRGIIGEVSTVSATYKRGTKISRHTPRPTIDQLLANYRPTIDRYINTTADSSYFFFCIKGPPFSLLRLAS